MWPPGGHGMFSILGDERTFTRIIGPRGPDYQAHAHSWLVTPAACYPAPEGVGWSAGRATQVLSLSKASEMSQESAQEEYDREFEAKDGDSEKLKAAFLQVADIRKFEIELYWKRAGYFWALIAIAFAGYFAILSSDRIPNKFFLSSVVGSIGFVFTFAWYLVNRGSKYWQENWENHLDLLEDEITGPLYKTLLERPGYDSLSEKLVTGPLSVSVSKINQWVSVFVLFVWTTLAVYSVYKTIASLEVTLHDWGIIGAQLTVFLGAVLSCVLMVAKGRTHKGEHKPNMIRKKTRIGARS
jgi:hypothetical protein